ncbi:hypothetical protein CTAYLR_007993 [Chrysophaeum taylorii]|uniref:Transmembrane protein n=1 Tax=Chrysophaeum taylorii TaxID=2483200 RepID=A0AAD7XKE9_9STRA|nr:hypothetical protein CTAYLR_007993 [Chrysophaeum taylorii]
MEALPQEALPVAVVVASAPDDVVVTTAGTAADGVMLTITPDGAMPQAAVMRGVDGISETGAQIDSLSRRVLFLAYVSFGLRFANIVVAARNRAQSPADAAGSIFFETIVLVIGVYGVRTLNRPCCDCCGCGLLRTFQVLCIMKSLDSFVIAMFSLFAYGSVLHFSLQLSFVVLEVTTAAFARALINAIARHTQDQLTMRMDEGPRL